MKLYQDKDQPWRQVVITPCKFEKSFFFRFKWAPNNKFMTPPRFHAMINLFLFSFWRDNSKVCLGVGLGKKHWQIVIKYII